MVGDHTRRTVTLERDGLLVSERPHGTHVKYVADRCRCDACRTAIREYERRRKQAHRDGNTPSHGALSRLIHETAAPGGGGVTVILGLDLALARTGWAHIDYEGGTLVDHGVIATSTTDPLVDRLRYIAREVRALATDASNVFVEQPIAYRSGTTTIRLGMVHGAVAVRLPADTPLVAIGITEVKRWATGHGNADKDAMRRAAVKRWEASLTADEADAAWIADLGRHLILAAIDDHPTGA